MRAQPLREEGIQRHGQSPSARSVRSSSSRNRRSFDQGTKTIHITDAIAPPMIIELMSMLRP
ncbi:hypothetical protein MTS1_02148 [Microbacterium sp. TS-1]|nr:hypothetical protein MTS1_02148 [Microbacterium sp. TS-1]